MIDPIDARDTEARENIEASTTPSTGEIKEHKAKRPGKERRRQHPDILTRIARGETEATALAFLDKELALSTAKKSGKK